MFVNKTHRLPNGKWTIVCRTGRITVGKDRGKWLLMRMTSEEYATEAEAAKEAKRLRKIPHFCGEGL